MGILSGSDDRIAENQSIGPDVFRPFFNGAKEEVLVPEHAQTAGQVSSGGKAGHQNAVWINLPAAAVFPDQIYGQGQFHKSPGKPVRRHTVVEYKYLAAHSQVFHRYRLVLPLGYMVVASAGTDHHCRTEPVLCFLHRI